MSYIRRKSNNPMYDVLIAKHCMTGKMWRKRVAETHQMTYMIRRPTVNTEFVEISETNNLEFIEEIKAIYKYYTTIIQNKHDCSKVCKYIIYQIVILSKL